MEEQEKQEEGERGREGDGVRGRCVGVVQEASLFSASNLQDTSCYSRCAVVRDVYNYRSA